MSKFVEPIALLVKMSLPVSLVFSVEFVDVGGAFCLEAFLESFQFGEWHFSILVIIDDPILLHEPPNILRFLINTFKPETIS